MLLAAQASAAMVTERDAQTGLRSWEWHEAGISLRLVQRLPDQTRAFFQARGFSVADADRIAAACVFQTIFRNDGAFPLSYSLDDWRVIHRRSREVMLTREHWAQTFVDAAAGEAAGIALHWALLPTRQRFAPGDYNWGMTSFGLAPGAVFDLEIKLLLDGDTISRTMPGIVCADDRTEN